MTRDEHRAAVQRLMGMIASDHQADASEILTSLSDDYEQTLTGYEAESDKVKNLTTANERLRAVNTDLFLKVGHKPEKEEEKHEEQHEEKPMAFEDLFNEKGELK